LEVSADDVRHTLRRECFTVSGRDIRWRETSGAVATKVTANERDGTFTGVRDVTARSVTVGMALFERCSVR
jgi:hypothetical protein